MINRFVAVLRYREHSGGESPRCQVCSAKNEPLMFSEVTAFIGRQGSAKNSTFKSETARSETNVLHLANMMRNADDDGTGKRTDFYVFFDNVLSVHNNNDDELHDHVKFLDGGGVVFERGGLPKFVHTFQYFCSRGRHHHETRFIRTLTDNLGSQSTVTTPSDHWEDMGAATGPRRNMSSS